MSQNKTPLPVEEEFSRKTGMSINDVMKLYQEAVANDWRTVQTTTQQALTRFAAARATAHESTELVALAQAIRRGEPG